MQIEDVVFEFDRPNRILHVTAKCKVAITTGLELAAMCERVQKSLREVCGDEPGYMIVDISMIAIDPSLVHLYAQHVGGLIGTCIHHDGIARYGYEITRLTARQGHRELQDQDPHLFGTKAEAFDYIHTLIETRSKEIPSDR